VISKMRWPYRIAATWGAITAVIYVAYLGLVARDMPSIGACAVGIVFQIVFFLLAAWVHNLRVPKQHRQD
jgi:hypothetical protein